MENGKELMKIDGGLLWVTILKDISILWLIQPTDGKIHGLGTDNTQVYPWQSLQLTLTVTTTNPLYITDMPAMQ